jgi:hypothetical protein
VYLCKEREQRHKKEKEGKYVNVFEEHAPESI